MYLQIPIAALVLALDGIITDTEPLHEEADRWTCETFGISVPNTEWPKLKGTTSRDMFEHINAMFADGTISVDDLIQAKRIHYVEIAREHMTLIPGALDFLRYIKLMAPAVGVVTSSNRGILDLVFEKYRLHHYFTATITGDDVKNGKPFAAPYLLMAQKLRMPPETICVIEDSINGVISAKRAGCRVIGITTTFPKEPLSAKGADIVVHSFPEIYDLLGN